MTKEEYKFIIDNDGITLHCSKHVKEDSKAYGICDIIKRLIDLSDMNREYIQKLHIHTLDDNDENNFEIIIYDTDEFCYDIYVYQDYIYIEQTCWIKNTILFGQVNVKQIMIDRIKYVEIVDGYYD